MTDLLDIGGYSVEQVKVMGCGDMVWSDGCEEGGVVALHPHQVLGVVVERAHRVQHWIQGGRGKPLTTKQDEIME